MQRWKWEKEVSVWTYSHLPSFFIASYPDDLFSHHRLYMCCTKRIKNWQCPPPHAWAGPNKSWLTKTVFRTFCPAIQVSYCDCDCDSELKITLSVIVRIASYQLIVICIGYVAYGYGVSQKRSGSMFWSRPRNCRYSIPSQFSSSPGQMCLHCTFDQGWKYSSLFANPHITSSTAGWALLRNKLGQAVHTLVTTTIDHRHHRKYC